jgi:hypothetical protein
MPEQFLHGPDVVSILEVSLRETPAAAALPSSGGRSGPGVSQRSQKSARAISRREFGLRDP